MYFNYIQHTVSYKNHTFNFASGVQSFIFDCGVENNFDKKYDIQTLIKYVYFVYQLNQKDDNPTPLGKLCDYVAQNWEIVENMNRSDILEQFYNTFI